MGRCNGGKGHSHETIAAGAVLWYKHEKKMVHKNKEIKFKGKAGIVGTAVIDKVGSSKT